MNYADWESDSIEARKCYEVALKHNKPIVVMEPIKGGALANPVDSIKKIFKEANPNALVENKDYFIDKWSAKKNDENILVRYKAKQFIEIIKEAEVLKKFDIDIYFKIM